MRILTSPCTRPTRCALLALALSLTGAPELRAQLRSVTAIQDLTFGNVLPGVRTTVPPTDVARSGQFEITGDVNDPVEITFGLPNALNGPGGATMLVDFTDMGIFSTSGSNTPFNPEAPPFRGNLGSAGRATGFLGGILTPSLTQSPGSYSGSVSVTVAFLGQ
jgi:hypothetical protein